MGNLSNLYISQSFQSLAHLGTNNALVPGTMTKLEDGIGQSLNISFDGTNISSSGNIYAANLTGSGAQTNTGSLLLTASVAVNVLTFTKGDGSQFNLTVVSSGSITPGTISGSAQITELGFVSSSVTASSLITASFDNNTRNLTFTKGDANTFAVNIPDTSGSAGNFVTTASFNSYTASNDQRVSSLEVNSASVNVSISNINTTTASLNTSVSNINTFTQSAQISINALNTNSASVNTSITNINSATASLFTSASLALVTASVNLNTITFTKGDGTTFPITVNTGSGGGATTNTGSLLVTASAFINTITFTKGDGTTFPVTVTTGSLNYVTGSFGAFYDTTTQSGSAGVAYSMKLNNTDISDGVIISGSGGIKVLAAGTYDLQFSAQVLADTGADTVWIWLKKNGTNVPDTSTKLVLRNNEADVAAWNFVVSANANDVFELAWQSSGGHTKLFAEAAASNYTAIPSVIATMNRVDVGGGTNLVSTSSFNSYTSSTNNRLTNIETTTASLNVSVTNLNSYTQSNDTKWNTLGTLSGSFATTGSNTFTGDQTLIDNAGNFFTISDSSGSMMLVAKGFTSASAHMSSSAAGIGNFIFKTNSNTADTIISGSSNLFTNATAPTAGFKRYIGGSSNIMLNASNVPQISGSMGISPTMNNNYYGNGVTITMRGPVSSSAWTISGNILHQALNIGNTAANNAEKVVSGLTITSNILNSSLQFIANRSLLPQAVTITNNQTAFGASTLTAASSSIQYTANFGGSITITNSVTGSANGFANSANAIFLSQNTFAGNTNTITASGSADPADTSGTSYLRHIEANQIFGTLNGVNLPYAPTGSNTLSSTIIAGYSLGVTGSSASSFSTLTQNHGSAFFGRYNAQDGNKAQSAQTIFAVGTGTSTSTRKTGFLIDSGSNTFVEGSLNISGSTRLTGSLTVSGSTILAGETSFINNNGNDSNVILGARAMGNITGIVAASIAIGDTAMRYASGTANNTAIGANTLQYTIGANNTALGKDSLTNNIEGNQNTGIGTGTLNNNTSGSQNTVLGYEAGYNNSTGSANTYLGFSSGKSISGSFNVILGSYQGSGETINNNIILADGQGNVKAQYSGSAWSLQDGIKLNKGSNKPCDIVNVLNGNATVNNSLVTTSSVILLTTQEAIGGAVWPAIVDNKTAGSFDIKTSQTSTILVAYLIINPTA